MDRNGKDTRVTVLVTVTNIKMQRTIVTIMTLIITMVMRTMKIMILVKLIWILFLMLIMLLGYIDDDVDSVYGDEDDGDGDGDGVLKYEKSLHSSFEMLASVVC